jgi:hypothetical protein
MGVTWGVQVEGLREMQRDIRRSVAAYPRVISQAVREAGAPVQREATSITVRKTGRLAGGWRVTASGSRGTLTNRVPYAGGAVWGKQGKWKGFQRYGDAPRFGPEAIERASPEIMRILAENLQVILTFYGWGSIDG